MCNRVKQANDLSNAGRYLYKFVKTTETDN